jgi:hypothetical protein
LPDHRGDLCPDCGIAEQDEILPGVEKCLDASQLKACICDGCSQR